MPDADALRAQLAVAELEEELASLKDGGDPEQLRAVKDELRFARWVQRGGPAEEAAALDAGGHTNRAVAGLYERWLAERG
jgi:hypothetical protein